MTIRDTAISLSLLGVLTITGNFIGYHIPVLDSLIGYALMLIITLAGVLITRVSPVKLPMVFWVSIVALAATMPASPISKFVTTYTNKIDFLAICTPVLAYAGLAIGKDIEAFKKMSWKIIIVALAVYTGTFLFATIIAEIMLHLEGTI